MILALTSIASTPWRYRVSVRVQANAEDVRARLPEGIGHIEAVDADPGWVRARIRAENLDWVPGVLIALDAPFVVNEPDELRARIRKLADRLTAAG